MQPRFLILRGGAIGDLILTLPVLQAIRTQWPDAYIELVGYPRTNQLVQASGLADELHSLDAARTALLYAHDVDLPLDMARWIASFTSVIHFLSDTDGLVTENLKVHAKHVVAQSPMPPPGTHATDHYLFALQELGVFEPETSPALSLEGETPEGPCFAIHAGSGGAHKNWPLDRFLQVAEPHANVAWIVGEADEAIDQSLPANATRWKDLSLLELATRLSGCRMFLGNDSGITHLAAALGVPTVALFGPSKLENWAPRGRGEIRIVNAPSGVIGDLGIDPVLEAVREMESGT